MGNFFNHEKYCDRWIMCDTRDEAITLLSYAARHYKEATGKTLHWETGANTSFNDKFLGRYTKYNFYLSGAGEPLVTRTRASERGRLLAVKLCDILDAEAIESHLDLVISTSVVPVDAKKMNAWIDKLIDSAKKHGKMSLGPLLKRYCDAFDIDPIKLRVKSKEYNINTQNNEQENDVQRADHEVRLEKGRGGNKSAGRKRQSRLTGDDSHYQTRFSLEKEGIVRRTRRYTLQRSQRRSYIPRNK